MEDLELDLTSMNQGTFDAILGMPWLKKYNPVINSTNGIVSINLKKLQTEKRE
jgi:hypothetical protein